MNHENDILLGFLITLAVVSIVYTAGLVGANLDGDIDTKTIIKSCIKEEQLTVDNMVFKCEFLKIIIEDNTVKN